tara:strand:+ start:1300 stop:2358 length:1059 start_codon:yes stop_codon:yes gene_type:complete
MKEGVSVLQNSSSIALEDAATKYFDDIAEDAVLEEDLGEELEDIESSNDSKENIENNNDTLDDVDTSDEEVHTEETEGNNTDLDKELSGFNQEFRDAVNLIEDTDLRHKMIEAGKKQRATIDRKHQELGEGKKLVDRVNQAFVNNNLAYSKNDYVNVVERYINFDAAFTKDPLNAIEILAKSANIDLSNLYNKTVQNPEFIDDQDDYRTPEEIALENRLKVLEQRETQRIQDIERAEKVSSQQQLSDFINSKDADGNLQYPHFEQVRSDMGLLITKPGMDLVKAYNQAVLLNDDLRTERESKLVKSVEEKRRLDIERAKKLKKQVPRSLNTKVSTSNPRALLSNAVADFYSN